MSSEKLFNCDKRKGNQSCQCQSQRRKKFNQIKGQGFNDINEKYTQS